MRSNLCSLQVAIHSMEHDRCDIMLGRCSTKAVLKMLGQQWHSGGPRAQVSRICGLGTEIINHVNNKIILPFLSSKFLNSDVSGEHAMHFLFSEGFICSSKHVVHTLPPAFSSQFARRQRDIPRS